MRADLLVQIFVEAQLHPGGARDELDRAVVVCRAEPAGDHAEVGACQPLGQRLHQLLFAVPHDRDPRRLDPQPQQLAGEERPVEVAAIATDELAPGDDDERAGTRGHTAGRMPRGVTIRVFTPPTGRSRVCPFRMVTRFSGRSSVIHNLRAVKSCFCP